MWKYFCRASRMNAHHHDWHYFTAYTIESRIKATLRSRLDLDFLRKIELFSSQILRIESNILAFVERVNFPLSKTLCNWSPVIWRLFWMVAEFETSHSCQKKYTGKRSLNISVTSCLLNDCLMKPLKNHFSKNEIGDGNILWMFQGSL